MIRFILAFKNNIGGGSASGSVTIQNTDIIVSGAGTTDVNGTYKLEDASATGYDRIWKNENGVYLYSGFFWGDTYNWGFGKEMYTDNAQEFSDNTYYNGTYNIENPWDCEWYAGMGSDEGMPILTLASGGSASGSETIPSTDIIVSGHSNPDVNGTYKLVDESATGYDRRWVKEENNMFEICSWQSGTRRGLGVTL